MSKKQNKRRIKILVWGDSPACATGFATVTRNVFKKLAQTGRYEIDIIGINDRGGYKDPYEHPYRIYPAKSGIDEGGDYFGRDRLIAAVLGKDPEVKPPWDIIFTINDPFILEAPLPVINKGTLVTIKSAQELYYKKMPPQYYFKVVSYWPVDSALRGNWIEKAVGLCDYPVAYTDYGKYEIEKENQHLEKPFDFSQMRTIYHGVNLKEFYPISVEEKQKFKEQYFKDKIKKDTFLVTAVARNQLRKDLPRTMAIFKEFQKRRPDSFLYLHCQENDAWGSLREYARNWDLRLGKDWGVPANFSANSGYPIDFMNNLYNASDVILSTSLGEGFGFYNLESFATRSLVVAPDNTTHPELFNYKKGADLSDMEILYNDLRGVPLKCQTDKTEWATYGPQDFCRVRPLVNVEDAVKKLLWIYDNPVKAEKIKENAYQWIQKYDWSEIALQWDQLFQEIVVKLDEERANSTYYKDRSTEAQSAESQPASASAVPETQGEHQ